MADKRATGRPRGRPQTRPTVKRNITVHADLDDMVAGMANHIGISYSNMINAVLRAWHDNDANTPTLPLKWQSPKTESEE